MASRGKIRPVKRAKPMAGIGGSRSKEDEFETCWGMLKDALTDIHNKSSGSLSFEQLYRASYKLVLAKRGEVLYDRVRTFEETFFREMVMPKIAALVSSNLVNITLVQGRTSSPNERRQLGEKFLRGVRDAWDDHSTSMNMITDILMYLERSWAGEFKKPGIFATTVGLFRDHILRNGNICSAIKAEGLMREGFNVFDIVTGVVLDLINMERDGDVIDRSLVHKIVSMLEDLYETDEEIPDQRLYLTVFEPRFLEASTKFYRQESEKLLRQTDASYWLRHTQKRLAEEEDRCSTSLSLYTSEKIAQIVKDELISAHLDEFLSMDGTGLKAMIDNDRIEDLQILYKLSSMVDPRNIALKKGVQDRVRDLGYDIEKVLFETEFTVVTHEDAQDAPVDDAEKPKNQALAAGVAQNTANAIQWVDDVLRLKDKFDNLWRVCFEEDMILQSAITKSFSEFINNFNRSSEFVSLFIDDNLKRGIKGKTELEVDAVLDKAIVLVRYLTDRDLFERYYQKHLARRLLYGKSESRDAENQMISRMKQEAGNHFTSKFEGMFKDIEVSRDMTQDYKEYIQQLGQTDQKPIELGINVLTTNNWPPEIGRPAEEGAVSIIYPPEIKRLQSSFSSYYLKDRSGRVLTWVSSTGTADIKCLFPKIPGKAGPLSKERRYELTVSTLGMVVLLLFNDLPEGEYITFQGIMERTNIPQQDLIKTLITLTAVPKCRVLLKEPAGKTVKTDDKFGFNAQFVSKTIKIKVPTLNSVSKVEADDVRKETEKKNDLTRGHVVDASIVRTMKSRKRLGHNELVTEVINQLSGRFKPEISLIKKRIEDLLAREYMERLDGEPTEYHYLA